MDLLLRPNVCILIFNKDKKLFLGERLSEPGVYQFPQGGVEPGLSTEENVLKEASEELGADKSKFRIVKKLRATHQYRFDKPRKYSNGTWGGQAQTFWLVEFLGADSDITLDRHNPEFSSWRWCTTHEVKRIAEPKRLPSYLDPMSEFEEFLVTHRVG